MVQPLLAFPEFLSFKGLGGLDKLLSLHSAAKLLFPFAVALVDTQALRNACCPFSGVRHVTFLASFAATFNLLLAERGRSTEHVKVIRTQVQCGVWWEHSSPTVGLSWRLGFDTVEHGRYAVTFSGEPVQLHCVISQKGPVTG